MLPAMVVPTVSLGVNFFAFAIVRLPVVVAVVMVLLVPPMTASLVSPFITPSCGKKICHILVMMMMVW